MDRNRDKPRAARHNFQATKSFKPRVLTFSNFIIHTVNNIFYGKTGSCSVSQVRVRLLIQAYVKRRMQAGPPQCCKRNCTFG